MSNLKNIFEHTDCLSEDMLNKYVSGKLSPALKHEVEKHLVDCDMCSDAVEGLQLLKDKNRISSITAELNEKIAARTRKKEVKIIFLRQYRTQLAVAASVAVLLGLVWFFRSNMEDKPLDPEAANKIFTENFEPYPSDEEADKKADEPAGPKLTVAEEREVLKGEKEERRPLNETADLPLNDKKAALAKEQEIVLSDNANKESIKWTENNYQTVVTEKQTAVPAPVTSATQSRTEATVTRDEVAAYKKEESKPEQKILLSKQEPAANTTATGTTSNVYEYYSSVDSKKDKEKDNSKVQQEREKNVQQVEKVDLKSVQKKSKSGKDRSITAAKEPETKVKAMEEVQAVPPAEGSGKIAVAEAISEGDIIALDSVTAGLSTPVGDDASKAMNKYDQQDFAGAVEDFEKTLAKDPDNYNALFYSSVSYLGTGETDKAIINLNKVLEKKDGEFYDAAKWYLSLAYIKKNDTENARKNLNELKGNPKSKYQKKADETLREMKK